MARLRVSPANTVDPVSWVERIGRVGFAVKGLTYLILAYLAMRAATGNGRAQNTRGALRSMDGATIGDIALLAISIGLGAYALWKLYFAVTNPEHQKPAKRLGAALVAAVNGGLALEAARLALSKAQAVTDTNPAVHWSALVLAQPLGTLALMVGGVAIAVYGSLRIVKAARAKLDEQLRLGELEPRPRKWIISASRIGMTARGVVFIMIGIFLVRAAAKADPTEARDFGYSLRELQSQPFGPWLLAVVAAGLFLYGVYELVRARYRRFETAS